MSDPPTIADAEEPRVVTDLVEHHERRVLAEINEQLEHHTRKAIAEVNWENVEVLDIIHKTRIEPDEFERTHGFQYHAYPSQELAPDVDTYYGIGEYNKQVYRLTEYACREIGIDPVTGEDTYD